MGGPPKVEKPDLAEIGAPRDGAPQRCERRLFVQLLAYTGCRDSAALAEPLRETGLDAVIYEDVHDPLGVAVACCTEDPGDLVEKLRPAVQRSRFSDLTPRPELTMLGRTYAIGFERDLEDWLLEKPRRTMLNPDESWAVWYPLRRSGAFEQLAREDQRAILGEHGAIGRAFGMHGLASDVRLACHGLDRHDNDFVIGLIGRELHPLSAIVQRMRSTRQTSQYLEKLGPFFVGRAVWRSRDLSSSDG